MLMGPPHLSRTLGFQPSAPLVAVKCGHLIDGTGSNPVVGAVVVIEGERIKAVGREAPPGATVVDLSGHYVLPGLIDCHTHVTTLLEGDWRYRWAEESAAKTALKSTRYARELLEAGFTSCRNVGASEFVDVALRDAINEGYVIGPRLFVAAHSIGMTGGHCDLNGFRPDILEPFETVRRGKADGLDEVRKAVRYQIKHGADVIKICATGGVMSTGDEVGVTQYSLEEIKVIVEEAHMLGRKVAAHAHGNDGIKRAVAAGVDSIEHGSVLDDEAVALMKQHGTYLVPTCYVGDVVVRMADEGRLPAHLAAKAREIVPKMRQSHRKAVAAGVKFAFGTDVGVFPHREAAREFRFLVEAGMTPQSAIVTATRNAADLLGKLADLGTVEAGKFADLCAVERNPLEDITRLEQVTFVMKGGQVVKSPTR
jgi:imidazolonepropionase-like amidohydrolase